MISSSTTVSPRLGDTREQLPAAYSTISGRGTWFAPLRKCLHSYSNRDDRSVAGRFGAGSKCGSLSLCAVVTRAESAWCGHVHADRVWHRLCLGRGGELERQAAHNYVRDGREADSFGSIGEFNDRRNR